VFSDKFVWEKIDYIHNNPVEAGLVKQPFEWVYSSATNYQDMESILEVETISQRLITE
jgi:putative transposase